MIQAFSVMVIFWDKYLQLNCYGIILIHCHSQRYVMVFNDTLSFSIMVYFVSGYDVFHSAYAARRVPTHINRIHESQMRQPIMN